MGIYKKHFRGKCLEDDWEISIYRGNAFGLGKMLLRSGKCLEICIYVWEMSIYQKAFPWKMTGKLSFTKSIFVENAWEMIIYV